MLNFKTRSAAETKRVGRLIGKRLKGGDVVLLEGGLGAGKTTIVKGITSGLGVRGEDKVLSPTFVLVHEYSGREPIYHMDWYRLDSVQGSDALLARECFDAGGVTLVEWPERGRGILPDGSLTVRLVHKGGDKREIRVSAKKGRGLEILGTIKE